MSSKKVDILLIAEGTYPYVRGGVSSWIDQLIKGLDKYTFAILFLGSKKKEYNKKRYELPENVLYFEEYFLFDPIDIDDPKPSHIKKRYIKKIENFYNALKEDEKIKINDFFDKEFLTKNVKLEDFLYSYESWEFIKKRYMQNCPELSFLDYFWAVRSIHKPLWLLAKIALKMDFAKVVHSPSTGYAGFLSALINAFFKTPFILTEHGIYIRERKIDIHSADALGLYQPFLLKTIQKENYLQQMWINFFEKAGFLTYQHANFILSLFQDAKHLQIKFGADEKKCEVIPNGVDVKRLNKLYKKQKVSRVITLLGRVVSIKDIKTFIRSIRIVADKFPDIEGWIVGPTDEDEIYANECLMMVESMRLKENIKFLGFQKVDDIFPKTKILTLTSISEGMPLVILEGFAAGLPCVATDVGSCKELIYGGLNDEDIKIGKAGEVVPVANPNRLAQSYIKLLSDEELWRVYQQRALKRVERFYTQELFFENYARVYQEALKWQE